MTEKSLKELADRIKNNFDGSLGDSDVRPVCEYIIDQYPYMKDRCLYQKSDNELIMIFGYIYIYIYIL